MQKLISLRNIHILSLMAVISLFFIAAIAHIQDQKAYVNLAGHTFEIGRCYYKTHFGFNCPSCGLTRGFISLENLDFKGAITFNPLSPFVYLMFVFLGIFNILSIRNNKHALFFGKCLAVYSFLTCIAIVLSWIFFYAIPLFR